MQLVQGKQYAFVGANGSGKTTIVKLITGLYEDYEGEILINGVEMRQYPKEKVKAIFSIIYQDYCKYYLSLMDTVLLGDVNKMGKSELKIKHREAKGMLYAVHMQHVVDRMPNGLLNHLGKIEKDGEELSEGEWQRIALARAFYRSAPFLILDEPTASMDPIVETQFYELFRELFKGRTSILITHRLAPVHLADEIFVIDDEKVVQQGKYEQLMKKPGLYCTMYKEQSSWYQHEQRA